MPVTPTLPRTAAAESWTGRTGRRDRHGTDQGPRRALALALPLAVLVGAVAVRALRPFRRLEVVGHSMAPGLLPGDRLVAVRRPPWRRLRAGDLVAVADPQATAPPGRLLVKRVAAVGPAGVELLGDAPARSTDSRTFGPVPPGRVVGLVRYRYGPPGRSGRPA